MSEENACYWTEVIRKGQFADKYEKGNNKNEADYFDDSEVEMFKAVKYLPYKSKRKSNGFCMWGKRLF